MDEVHTFTRPTHTFEWDSTHQRWSLREDTGRFRAHSESYDTLLEIYLDDMGLSEAA